MLKNINKGINDLKGTASELKENRAYDSLVELVGESGAERAIQRKLEDRGITPDEWEKYRKVRSIMHRNPLGIPTILKEVNELTEEYLEA